MAVVAADGSVKKRKLPVTVNPADVFPFPYPGSFSSVSAEFKGMWLGSFSFCSSV